MNKDPSNHPGFFKKIKSWASGLLIKYGSEHAAIYALLRNLPLFDSLDKKQLSDLSKTATHISCKPGDIILKQGDLGDNFYLIKRGAVRIYVTNHQDNTDVVLARLEQGEYFGEQALLEESPGKRMASAKAITECELYAVSHAAYQKVLNPELKHILKNIGEKELYTMFGQTQEILSLVKQNILKEFVGKILKFSNGDIIFKIHDKADYAYFILSGCVEIEIPDEKGTRKTDLQEGALFGELGVLNQAERAGTAIAKGDVSVLAYDIEVFQKLYQTSPDLQQYINSLKNVYQIKARGTVHLYCGKFLNMNAVTIIYNLDNGQTVTAAKAIGNLVFMMTYNDVKEVQTLDYVRGTQVRRKLAIKDNKIVSISSFGEWRQLNEICSFLLNAKPITNEQIENFKKTGDLEPKKLTILSDDERKEMICNCLNVTKGQIFDAIGRGVNKLDDIIKQTGAGSVCGNCRPRIVELLGMKAWTTVKLIERKTLHPNIFSFKFQSVEFTKMDYKPGQYMVISALINGEFISRSYTLTSLSDHSPYIEIMIKKEPKGYFSPWLVDQAKDDSLIRVSDPHGEFILGDDENVPAICFVAGIGVTPAIAFARHVSKTNKRKLFIDYSARTKNDFILVDEWKELASKHKNISVGFRSTQDVGRLKEDQIKKIVDEFPNGEFYICGPRSFEEFILKTLSKYRVPKVRIKTEEFIHAGSPDNESIKM